MDRVRRDALFDVPSLDERSTVTWFKSRGLLPASPSDWRKGNVVIAIIDEEYRGTGSSPNFNKSKPRFRPSFAVFYEPMKPELYLNRVTIYNPSKRMYLYAIDPELLEANCIRVQVDSDREYKVKPENFFLVSDSAALRRVLH